MHKNRPVPPRVWLGIKLHGKLPSPEAAMKKNTAQDDWVYLQYPQALFVPSAIALMQQ